MQGAPHSKIRHVFTRLGGSLALPEPTFMNFGTFFDRLGGSLALPHVFNGPGPGRRSRFGHPAPVHSATIC
jgi:hypothetical protein